MTRSKIFGNILPLVFWIFVSLGAPCYSLGAEGEKNVSPEEMRLEADRETPTDSTASVPTLPTVTVVAAPEDRATGKSTIGREAIERLPEGNGSINELLKVLPGVQFSDKANTSLQGGEILPPNVSISGGKVFQNNFTIDGISNNSFTDPAQDDPTSQMFLPGHPQEIFLNADLIEITTVYDNNVPARYGEFTGGVVDARTRDPEPTFGGSLRYRTTSDRWTEFHVDKASKEDFENSADHSRQPRFEKHDGGALLNIPLGAEAGMLASYQILDSRIPLRHLGEDKAQSRRLENYFLKYAHDLSTRDRLTAAVLYAPFEGEYFYRDAKDSDFTLEGGGGNANTTFQHAFAWGEFRLLAAYRFSENTRKAPAHLRTWLVTDSKDWGTLAENSKSSLEGSLGSLETKQHSWQAKGDLAFAEFTAGPLMHTAAVGVDFERVRGSFERPEESHLYFGAKASDSIICEDDSFACIDSEQYFPKRYLYQADSVTATIDQYRFYAEDRMRLGRLELRPGLRLSYEDFTKNRNVAPRLAAALDVFGNGDTVLVAGRNRYYGRTLLAYKLREGSKPYILETRSLVDNRPTPWEPFLVLGSPLTGRGYGYSKLKTPYADETVLGLDQALLGGIARLRYIEREGNDEFARDYDTESKTYFLNNNGFSRHRAYRIAWERWWKRHYLAINATYEKTTLSNENYSEDLDIGDLEKQVWHNGEILNLTKLPRENFNRSWVANLTYSASLPFGFTFTNFTKYRSGYRALGDTKENIALPDGTTVDVYDGIKQPESWIFDWKIDWRKTIVRDQALVVSLEIDNVFDQKVSVGAKEDEFELGRRFWAGAEYRF